MLNLVQYRKIFIYVSLLVIIPGVIALALWGLNVGIDFAGGTNIVLRPQHNVTDADAVSKLLMPFNLESEQIILGKDTKGASNTVWVRLDTKADDKVITSIVDTFKKNTNQTDLQYDTSTVKNGDKTVTLLTVTKFAQAQNVDSIKAALNNLPNTTDTSSTASSLNGAAAPTAAVPTTTPTAKGTSTVTPTSTATASQNTSAGTIPVHVADVQVGDSDQTINILTKTTVTKSAGSNATKINLEDIQSSFLQHGGPYFQVQSTAFVGPSVAGRTTLMAILAVIAASFLILLYVWFSFRKIAKALRYGVCAIVALLHDALVVLGIFSILGHFFGIQVDSLFITALLTVIGFSVHDTIVVFDRIRENSQRSTVESFEEIVNASLIQTLARSLNTSLTVLFTLLTLTLFTGIGTNIHTFTLTLLIGIFSGTYSSIFNASMLLVIWEKGELGTNYLKGNREKQYARPKREVRELANTRS